jgi:hypothetical protein
VFSYQYHTLSQVNFVNKLNVEKTLTQSHRMFLKRIQNIETTILAVTSVPRLFHPLTTPVCNGLLKQENMIIFKLVMKYHEFKNKQLLHYNLFIYLVLNENYLKNCRFDLFHFQTWYLDSFPSQWH